MKIYNLGSLNIDYVYSVEHFVTAGETLPVIAVFKKIEDYFQKFILNTNFATVFFSADC